MMTHNIFISALKFLVLLGAFGISCYLFAEVKKEESEDYPANKNALAMIPICFTGYVLNHNLRSPAAYGMRTVSGILCQRSKRNAQT